MTMIYQKICAYTDIAELRNRLPKQIRQAVIEVIEADSRSEYFYKLAKGNYQIQFFLIEHNLYEPHTTCHCFSTDMMGQDRDYAYESMSLSSIETLFEMANELKLTSHLNRL